jgi:hypothetical protein
MVTSLTWHHLRDTFEAMVSEPREMHIFDHENEELPEKKNIHNNTLC